MVWVVAVAARRVPLARREVWTIAGYGCILAGVQWTFLAYLVLYLTSERGFSLAAAGAARAWRAQLLASPDQAARLLAFVAEKR